MRIVMTWIVGIFLIGTIILTWYVTQPLIVKTTNVSDEIIDSMGANTSGWESTKTINLYVANLWPVPFILIILLWCIISSQRDDPESVIYG